MYFVKKLVGNREQHGPIDWQALWRTLDFQGLINYANRKKELAVALAKGSSSPRLPPELAAAVHAHVDYRARSIGGPETNAAMNQLANAAVRYCELMLYEQDYISTSGGQLIPSDRTVPLFVFFGAQTPDILSSRIKAGVDALAELDATEATIVFSGKNPGDAEFGKTQTPNEAVELEHLFWKAVDSHPILKRRRNKWEIKLENKSSNSRSNLQYTLTVECLKEPTWLYLVSSTFHLPRLARLSERHIEENGLDEIKQIILVGAERRVEWDPVVKTPPYLKWMMFVVYEHVLRHSPWGKSLADSERSIG